MYELKLIEAEEFFDRQRAGNKHGDPLIYIEVGMAWFMPWVWDHQDPDLEQYLPGLIRATRVSRKQSTLSYPYLTEWALKRDPVAVMLPSLATFSPDSVADGGRGWHVTGPISSFTIDKPFIDKNGVKFMISEGVLTMRSQSNV